MTENKKGATPCESAPQSKTSDLDSIANETPRAIYNPLTWRSEKPARFRGKTKRKTRCDAIARKRGGA